MRLEKAQRLVKKLINQYCPEYSFKFDNAKLRFGQCDSIKKIISLSKSMTQLNPEKKVRDCILHEIAHALTPGQHHNSVWRQKAISIGCSGERLHRAKTLKGKYRYVCPVCGYTIHYHRKPKYDISCYMCSSKYNPKYKMKLINEEIKEK